MKSLVFGLVTIATSGIIACFSQKNEEPKRPNILFAIADDQSFDHTSFAGAKFQQTPAFDRVAKEGVYFSWCIAGSPGNFIRESQL